MLLAFARCERGVIWLKTNGHRRGVVQSSRDNAHESIRLDTNQFSEVIWPRLGHSILQWSSRNPKLTSLG